MFGVVPLFGLASAGVSLGGGIDALADPLPLGILLGLLVGKPLGVFAAIYAVVRLKLAPMPRCTNWRQLLGAAALCGIGFTMSLFIVALAFAGQPALVESGQGRHPRRLACSRRWPASPSSAPPRAVEVDA